MEDRGKCLRWRVLAWAALLLVGCDGQDADRLGRIGHKVVDKMQAQTGGAQDRLPDNLQSIRGGVGEFALDAKVAARLHWDKELEGTPIQVVAVGGGAVKLSGTVPNWEVRQRAISVARDTAGVTGVVDELAEAGGR
jgi:osmotically-inducible protein OsmY